MKIIGCDFHPAHQLIAVFDTMSGEAQELKLIHANAEASRFHRPIEEPALIGMEAAGRFRRGKQVSSYRGLIPSERSSGSKRRMGAISKQGNVFLRTMRVESAQSVVRDDETFRKE